MADPFTNISLNETCTESPSLSPRAFIDTGLNDLKESIRSLGLIQPITVYHNSATGCYEVITGYRRLKAYVALNKENPNDGYDTIAAMVIGGSPSEDLKKAISLAEGLTHLEMNYTDLVKAVTDLYNTYRDYDIVQKKFGLTRYMVDKYVRLARLPERLLQAINEGEISLNTKAAENDAIRALDALNWQKDGDVEIEDVVKLAKEIAKGDIQKDSLEEEAKNGGTVSEIIDRASKKPVKQKIKITLSSEVFEKLSKISDQFSEKPDLSKKIEEIAKSMNMDPEKLLMDAINDIYSKYKKDIS